MVEEGKLFSMAAIVGILLNNLLAAMRQTLLQISRMERKGVIIMTTFYGKENYSKQICEICCVGRLVAYSKKKINKIIGKKKRNRKGLDS